MLLDLFRAPAALPDVVVPAHVGGASAYAALVRDGALRPIRTADPGSAPVALRASATDDPAGRASALLRAGAGALLAGGAPIPSGAVVALQTALWVHAGGQLTATVHVSRATPGRPPLPRPGLTWHELRLRPEDVEVRSGLALTTAVRTSADLALLLAPADARRTLETILPLVALDDVAARLADEPRSGRARDLVRRLAAAQSCSAGAS